MQSYSHDIGSLPKGKYYFPRYLSLTDLIKTLTEPANALDYDIIRPILLSIPSFTSPFEFFRCIVDRFYEANSSYVDSDQIKFKALAILHCWLEQPFAHADLAAASFEKHLKKFLRQVAGEKNDFFANITQSIRILLRRLIAEKKQLELAHQLYKLRSTASLGDGLCESMHLSSFAVDNVRVLESPLLKECAENYVGRHEESDRYSGVYFNNNASSSSGGGGSFSESCSYDDLSGEVIRSLLANDNDGKGDGATASYSTVRLSGSISNKNAWVYNQSAPGPPSAATLEGSGGKSASLDVNTMPKASRNTSRACSVQSICRRSDQLSVNSTVRSSRAGGELMASAALTLMNKSVIQMYTFEKLAELLTIIESELGWGSLRHREVINQLWMKEDSKHLHPDLGGASHLTKFISATDQRMSWVASEIIFHGVFVGPISDALEYFIKVAHSAYLRNNYNTFFSIMGSLGLPCIKHLKTGWANCSRSKITLYTEMLKLCSPLRNYAAYRKSFDATFGSPRVPCLQVFIKDIKMIDSLHPSLSEDGLVDVYKILYMYKVIASAIPFKMFENGDETITSPMDKSRSVQASLNYEILMNGINASKIARDGEMEKCSSYDTLINSMIQRKIQNDECINLDKKCAQTNEIGNSGRKMSSTGLCGAAAHDIVDDEYPTECFESNPIDIDSDATSMSKMALQNAVRCGTAQEHKFFSSLIVIPSFNDARGAFRESLFEPIRNSAHVLSTCLPGQVVNYVWDHGSQSITIHDGLHELKDNDSDSQKVSNVSTTARSSDLLGAIFGPSVKKTGTKIQNLEKANKIPGHHSFQLFTLSATDSELAELLAKIRSSIADLNNLWNDSKVANFAETGRLLLQLCKAGLI